MHQPGAPTLQQVGDEPVGFAKLQREPFPPTEQAPLSHSLYGQGGLCGTRPRVRARRSVGGKNLLLGGNQGSASAQTWEALAIPWSTYTPQYTHQR